MNLPTQKQIEKLWDKYEMPEHIREHSIAVAGFVVDLAKKIKANGTPVDINLVRAGALLHDIAKWPAIEKNNIEHEKLGEKILLNEDISPEIARITGNHLDATRNEHFKNLPIEDNIVSYADKRILNGKVVSVRERYDELYTRYDKKV